MSANHKRSLSESITLRDIPSLTTHAHNKANGRQHIGYGNGDFYVVSDNGILINFGAQCTNGKLNINCDCHSLLYSQNATRDLALGARIHRF